MITNESLNASFAIVDRAAKAKVLFKPSENTVLAACIQSSNNQVIENFTGETGFNQAWQESLAASPVFGYTAPVTISDGNGDSFVTIPTSVHSKTIEEGSDVIAMALDNAVRFTQNVAATTVELAIEQLNEGLEVHECCVEKYEIIDINPNEAWDNPVVIGALDNFKHFASPKILPRGEVKSIKLPLDYAPEVRTGSASIDSLVGELLESTGLSLVEVINDIFNGNDDPGRFPPYYWRDANLTLVRFLVSQWLMDNPIEGSGLDSTNWTTLTTRLSTAYGSLANLTRIMWQNDLEQNKLFYLHDQASDKIYLNGAVYDKWLNAGGTPELIFGSLMAGNYELLTYEKLLENSTMLLQKWTATHAILQNSRRAKHYSSLRELLFKVTLNAIEALDEGHYAPGATKVTMLKCARESIGKLLDYQLDNMADVCVEVICTVLFPHTPALMLLKSLNSRLEDGASESDALTDAVIEYCVRWILSGVSVIKA